MYEFLSKMMDDLMMTFTWKYLLVYFRQDRSWLTKITLPAMISVKRFKVWRKSGMTWWKLPKKKHSFYVKLIRYRLTWLYS